jgi:competence protein ComEC
VSEPEATSPSAKLDVRLVPAALTCWLVTAAGIWWPVGRVLAWCFAGLVIGVLTLRMARRDRRRFGAVSAGLVAVGVVGAGFGFAVALRADAVGRHTVTAAFGTTDTVTVTPTESPLSVGAGGHGRLMFRATLQRVRDQVISGRVVVFARAAEFASQDDAVMVGQPMRFTARISRPTRRDLTVAVLTATGRPTVGTAGAVQQAAHRVRGRFAAAAGAALPAEEAAMLPALVLGDTSAVSEQISADFRTAGLTHLMAVSGANVTIVCGAVLFCARVTGPRAAVALAAVVLVAFVVVVQPTASVLRAAVMGAIALAGMVTSRRRQAIPALSATVLIVLGVAPHLAVDVGFALSVLATGALVVIAPAWSRWLVHRGCPTPLAQGLAVACAAHLVTAPLIAGISGRLSLVAVGANLAAAPAIAPITVLGSAAAALCPLWQPGAQMLVRFTGPELWWVVHVARWAAAVPAATVPVPAGVAGVLVVAAGAAAVLMLGRFRRFRFTLGAVLACLGLCSAAWAIAEVAARP